MDDDGQRAAGQVAARMAMGDRAGLRATAETVLRLTYP